MEIIWRFSCLMVEFKCLASRVIALNTTAQLNEWNLQLGFLRFKKKNFWQIFFRIFFKVFKVEKPYFFVRRPKRILVIIIIILFLTRFLENAWTDFHEILIKNKKVLGPNRVDMNGLLETGSAGTGSWLREIPMALLIAIDLC